MLARVKGVVFFHTQISGLLLNMDYKRKYKKYKFFVKTLPLARSGTHHLWYEIVDFFQLQDLQILTFLCT